MEVSRRCYCSPLREGCLRRLSLVVLLKWLRVVSGTRKRVSLRRGYHEVKSC